MTQQGPNNQIIPADDFLARVLEIYQRGQSVDAFKLAETAGPIARWSGVRATTIASRILSNVGAPRMASRMVVRSWRANRTNLDAQVEYCFFILEKRGPFAAWQWLNKLAVAEGTAQGKSDMFGMRARLATDLRNFSASEKFLEEAEAVLANVPWVRLQRAHLLEAMEKVNEALETARAACALHKHPFYRPGVQSCAYFLQLLDRKDEAIDLLQRADACLQSAHVASQLYVLYTETGRWADAAAQLDRYEALCPAMEPHLRKWLTGQRARVAYFRGERQLAVQFAEQLTDKFNKRFAEKLKEPAPEVERVALDVPFVRQHFKTCAPATLAALGRFWKMPADQLVIVEAVCYDGTPGWQQRKWAEQNGWIAREFNVTWDSAVALLSAGIPFALTTSEATSAHMQAVTGFDRTRGTLLLRDPSQPVSLEADAVPFLERYKAFGPTGIVFMPKSEESRLDGIKLPQTALHDIDYELALALSRHDRAQAVCAIKQMEACAPEHRLTWEARLHLAYYDSNVAEQTRCLDELLKLFPNAAARLLQRFYCMRDVAQEERLNFLLRACEGEKGDPALFVQIARLYLQDARNRSQAAHWIRRALRARPVDSGVIGLIAEYLWLDGDFNFATEHYRIAADLESFRENLYQSWFNACRRVRKTNEAMEVLQERFERFGTRSEQPALTLAWALDELEQPTQARDVLTRAMTLRSDDAYLRLRAATQHARVNDFAGAQRLLESARGKIRENDWLRTAAQIAEWRLDTADALKLAKELLGSEPLAMDARRGVARCTLQLYGPEAALAEVQKACDEFPHHCELRRMLLQYSTRVGPEKAMAAARELLQIAPSDAWAMRELAVALLKAKRFEEALEMARKAEAIEPNVSASYGILAQVHAAMGAVDEAIKFCRRAIEISVDYTFAIHEVVDLAGTDSRRREQLAFIERELMRQVVTGEGLLAYVEVARPVVSPIELLNLVRRAQSERPDLWESWTALISELMRIGQLEEALKFARGAVERFAHMPGAWLDLCRVNGRLGNAIEELTAAEHAFEMNPAWTRSTLALAHILTRTKSLDDAKKIFLRAMHHSPRDAQLHAEFATILWRQREVEPAFCELERALRLAPETNYAWDRLIDWCRQVNQPERPAKLAATIAAERPGEMRNWLILAQTLTGRWDSPERLQAIDRALALAPASLDVWDYKVELFARAGQFGQALAVADEGLAVVKLDRYALEGRRAWVLALKGNTSEAISAMRKVLTENAGYSWGWHQLITWLVNQRAWVDAEDAIDKLLRLQPRNTWALRQRGHLQVAKNELEAAKKTFKAVLAIDPTDRYSAEQLFDLQVEANDVNGAAETLALMRTHQPGGQTVSDEIVLRLRKGEDKEALQLFEQLCKMPDSNAEPVETAWKALRKNRMNTHGLKIIKRVLRTQGCHRRLGVVLMNYYVTNLEYFRAAYQLNRIADSEVKRHAADVLAETVAKKTSSAVLRMVVWFCRATFRSSDEAWGHVGYGFSRWRKHRATVSWLSDWEGRKEVEPWMLFNLCLALREQGKYEECVRISNVVLKRWPHHDSSSDVQMFLAIESALALRVDEASTHLAKSHVRREITYDQQLILLARTLVTFLQTEDRYRVMQSWAAYRSLKELPWGSNKGSRDIRRTYKRVARVICRNGAGLRARVWFFLRVQWPWMLPTAILFYFYLLVIWSR